MVRAVNFRCIEESGPWPFVTRRIFRDADRLIEWSSRHHRKRLALPLPDLWAPYADPFAWLWNPRSLNWWIGLVFAIGSFLFGLASVLALSGASVAPSLTNGLYLIGSIPFTVAAWMQLAQAANAENIPGSTPHRSVSRRRFRLIGWQPANAGWWSCLLQFAGTLLFNLSTLEAWIRIKGWFWQDLVIWVPNLSGSVLFLASGYLAFAEAGHRHWWWQPGKLTWQVVFANLLGCIGFMISAPCGVFLPDGSESGLAAVSTGFTLVGAVFFLVGSGLLMRESLAPAVPVVAAIRPESP